MKILSGQKTYTDYNRLDVRNITAIDRIIAPQILKMGHNANEAVVILAEALGISSEERYKIIESPIEKIIINKEKLLHLVEKRDNARERYANFILPTIITPYEIWAVKYEDGVRNRYIGVFTGKYNLAVVAMVNLNGSLLWNIMNMEDKKLNKHREGELVWVKQKR